MGMVWEASQKGVPFLGVPGNSLDLGGGGLVTAKMISGGGKSMLEKWFQGVSVPDHPRIISEMISGGEVQPPEGRVIKNTRREHPAWSSMKVEEETGNGSLTKAETTWHVPLCLSGRRDWWAWCRPCPLCKCDRGVYWKYVESTFWTC